MIGRTGQVGWELERSLASLGSVQALDRRDLDITDFQALVRAIRRDAPELIVNAAAHTAVDQAEQEPEVAMRINGEAPGVMAEEAKRLGAALVHFSTDYVFGGGDRASSPRRPYREDEAPKPANRYGLSKLAGERAIQAVGCDHLILRTAAVYARRGRNFLRTIQRLAAERSELRVVDDQITSPTWARAVAETAAQLLAMTWLRPSARGPRLSDLSGVYHFSAGGQASWFEFAAEILAGAADGRAPPQLVAITTAEYPTPARRPSYSTLDNSKLEKTFDLRLPEWRTQLRLCLAEDR